MTVRKFLDISTAHLRPSTRAAVANQPTGLTVHPHPDGYGWFVYVSEDEPEPGDAAIEFEDLAACIDRARALDCDYILFDCDAELDDTLPTYE
jgi:hypothetical protein